MSSWLFYLVSVWLLALIGILVAYACLARSIVERALAADALAILCVSVLIVAAIRQTNPGYLDVALVLSLLAFAQTVATVRFVERRKELE